MISGKKYWSDGTPVAGQQFEYRFDDIGNRRTNGFGGNEAGLSLRESRYTVNDLNQYTSRTVPGYVNALGEAAETASVSVNTTMAYRQDRYFRAELSVSNSANPVWLSITKLAVLLVGGGNYVVSNVTGHVLWPKTPETFTYDADGNLTSDGLWTNQWNAENRRTVIESRAGVPAAARRREQWTHLPDGRWIERIVSTNNGTAYYPAFTNRYVWDGQVLLAVLDHANNVVLSFLRGLDLSGSQAGAGGVGGLLFIGHFGSAISHHAVAYDGNGNVAALVNAADGTETARYEYGPFGEPLRLTGPMASANPIRFSTQYADDVTGDVKYLFRDYGSSTGRWCSRDPSGDDGRRNLYAFVHNVPLNGQDVLGLQEVNVPYKPKCAPCEFLGWFSGMPPGFGDAIGYTERIEEPMPSPAPSESCGECPDACGKCWKIKTRKFECKVKIYLAVPYDHPTHTMTAGEHEAKHAEHFADSFANRDLVVKVAGNWCLPLQCHEIRVEYIRHLLRSGFISGGGR